MEQATPGTRHAECLTARDKVKSLGELKHIVEAAKSRGESVVLAHGVFDLLHIGHIRHLEAAAKEGDVLVATVTVDCHVNKGPDRPVFTDQLRAEAVAALEHVDWVAINHEPTAENVIKALQPDAYVKGIEYKDSENDITGKIDGECGLVQSYGGRVVFTEDITYSSSSLINRYLDVFEPSLKNYLEGVRDGGMMDRLNGLLDKVQDMNVLFIGDAIIDEYRYIKPLGKSPKENMIATLYEDNEVFAGGVFAAANHIAGFCKSVEIVTGVGDDGYLEFAQSASKRNVKISGVVRKGTPTTRKCRYIDTGYNVRKLFEVYHMDDSQFSGADERALLDAVSERANAADIVIVTDFGHGLMTDRVIARLTKEAKFVAVNAQSNSANLGFNLITKYHQADYICIDQPEARLAVMDNHSPIEQVTSEMLPERIDCPRIVVTRGKNGCLAYERDHPLKLIPGFTNSIVDTVGAGDAFFAVSAPFVCAGASMEDAGFIGNAAGAMKVGIVGHRQSVDRVPFHKFVTTLLK